MKSTVLWTLALLNAVLASTFVFRLFPDNAAHAQAPRANTRPGDYIMIPGALSGGSAAIVYVLDSASGMLSAMAYEEPRNEIRMMSSLDLSRVFEAGASVGAGGTGAAGVDRRNKR